MNYLITSIGLGCIAAALAQWILPGLLTGKFLQTAAVASIALIVMGMKRPRLRRR